MRDGNFSLEGLVGFDLYGKTAGVIGLGKIGMAFARVLCGLGLKVLAYDVRPDAGFALPGLRMAQLEEVLSHSDIISLHVPLTPATHHLINGKTLRKTKKGVMLINTGRGGLIDTVALIESVKSGHVGCAGLDVYEEEGIFFSDHSGEILQDDHLARLMTFPNVLITSHQAFLTREALANIAETTLRSIRDFEAVRPLECEIRA